MTVRRLASSSLAVAAALLAGSACSSDGASLPPLDTPMGKAEGARVLDHANLVTVTFDDTSAVDSITTLGDWLVSSSWYAAVGEGYGVGGGTHHVATVLEDSPAQLVDADFAQQVDDWVDEGALPASGEDVFMFFLGSGAQSVDVPNVAGWHEITPKGRVYAVILPPCPGAAADPFTVTSFVAAHELIEAATDPDTVNGYRFVGAASEEVADVCNENVFVDGYSLPTVWSNPAAASGLRPCVPSTAPFFTVDATPSVLHIGHAAGSSATATLTGWSTERVGDWAVLPTVIGADGTYFNAFTAIDASAEMNDGSSLQLTVQVNTDVDPSAQVGILLVSSATSPYGPGPWQAGAEVTSVLLPLVVDP